MTKIRVVLFLVVLGGVAVLVFLFLGGQPEKPRYVFLICLDAVRPDHLGCYGYQRDTSPCIDGLACQGALFEDAVSQAPWTLPSIATILSSTFPCQHGARRTEGTRVAYSGVSQSFTEDLCSLGFKTALFTGGLAIRGKIPAAELSQAALDWLAQNLEQPCFIVIHHYDTHSPYVAGADCIESLDPHYQGRFMYRFGDFEMLRQARVGRLAEAIQLSPAEVSHIKTLYDCQIIRADKSVGTIVDSLRAWDCLDRSMLIIFADHGEEFLEHGSIDHGQTVHEESIRVPLVVFCPSLITKPVRIQRQVGLIDLGPTILEAVGAEKPAHCEGMSLMPLVSSAFKPPASYRRPCGLSTACLISESIARRSEKKALRRPPWKLIYDPFFGTAQLYDISADPFETRDLVQVEPGMAESLLDTLLVMQKYYPGGWCIAWRSPANPAEVRGSIRVNRNLVEALPHNLLPEIDIDTDSLVIGEDWKLVRFAAAADTGWQGVEARMTAPAEAVFNISIHGRRDLLTAVGYRTRQVTFPLQISPSQAQVDRKHLHRIFEDPQVECAVYWIEPGTEPTAKRKQQAELRQQLKAIGYID